VARFSRQFWSVFLAAAGLQMLSVQQIVGTFSKVLISGQVVQQYRFGTFSKAEYLGAVFGCCKWISLAGNCIVVADISFLKLIKSLSLIGFPHIGVFPGIA
jgi:hypothetical protein